MISAATLTCVISMLGITGGTEVTSDSAVLRLEGGQYACSAIHVAPAMALTAAHCLGPDLRVFSRASDAGIAITHTRAHPLFAPSGLADLAVLTLETPSTAPVMTWAAALEANQAVTLTGWGRTETGTTAGLREAHNQVARVRSSQFTVSTLDGAGNACDGDSGGAVSDAQGRLVGIISGGLSTCGRGDTVHTRLDVFGAWVSTELDAGTAFDSEPPRVTLPGLSDGLVVSGLLPLHVQATDARGVVALEYQLDDETPVSLSADAPDELVASAFGPHRLTVRATDGAMNVGTQTLSFTNQPTRMPRCDVSQGLSLLALALLRRRRRQAD